MHHSLYRPRPRVVRCPSPSEPVSQDVRSGLDQFAAFLDAAQRTLGRRAPLRLIQTLLDVVAHPDTTRAELAVRVDTPVNTASQDLRTLSVERRDGSLGLGLIEARWDATDVRLLRYRTTPQGDVALARLGATLQRQP